MGSLKKPGPHGKKKALEAASLGELLRWRAAAEPERQAFTFLLDGDEDELHLSYGALDRRARAVASRLQASGLEGERVLLLFPPGLDYAAAFLGCLYARTIAVPAYPPTGSRGLPRLQAILTDCSPRGILTVAALRPTIERLLGPAALTLAVDEIPEETAGSWQDPGVTAGDLAFLQYTSGSTSTPKGVAVSHGNLLANEGMIQEAFGTEERSVVVSWLPLYHDMGLIGGLLHPLYLGARCILLSPLHFLQRPGRWLRAITRYQASVSGGPNFAYELCARRVSDEEAAALDLGAWKVAFNGAEPVRAEVLERFAARFAPAGFRRSAFFPCYGLAEATLLVSGGHAAEEAPVLAADAEALAFGRVEASQDADGARRLVGCGRLPSGLDVRIVDPATSQPAAPETVGEIWVSGATVAGGYWNRPRESDETFGARLAGTETAYLRTGDLGFFHGGELYVSGRIKDLIVIRGRNLYPQDVEWTVERSHAALRPGCGAAFSVEDGAGERLVVVQEIDVRAGAPLDEVAEAVRRTVAEEHEVQVSSLVLVKAGGVPKTTSGKIQRSACRALFLAQAFEPVGSWDEGPAPERERIVPRTPAEERMARLWEEILELPPGTVGAEDSFFALGGDSLRGSQLVSRLEEALGLAVTLEELFAAPTVAALAARLPEHGAGEEGPRPPIPHADRGRPLPLTSPQRRLWFLDQLEPGNPAYNLSVAVRLTGGLDPAVLSAALQEIVRRHEALRTMFLVIGGAPAQTVTPAGALRIPIVDLSALPDPERAASALAREEARRAFDLGQAPLLRIRLARLGAHEHELQVDLHHIVSDAWSIGVLLREVAALYGAFQAGRPSPLAEPPVQYGDFAVWQEHRAAEPEIAEQLEAWRRRLAGSLPVLALPADRPHPPVRTYRGAHAVHPLPAGLVSALRELAGSRGASLFMALLAGYQALLHRLTAQQDLIVGTAIANRDRPELERLIGFFVNTLALRTDLAGDPSFADLLDRARETALAAYAGREVPFERLLEAEKQPARDLSRTPIVQTMLVLQNAPLTAAPPPGLAMTAREIDNGTARFDLAVSLVPEAGGLNVVFKYSRELFDAPTIDRLAGAFARLLEAAAADSGRRISELPLLGPAEQHQVLAEWNGTAAGYPQGLTLHQLFEAQAGRTPEAVAVVFEGQELTYRELDERANRLAGRLRGMGVGPDVVVGVAIERSLELVVALYGVLKAGGAYLPLDPSYPADRLAFMVEDARALLVLTGEESWEASALTGRDEAFGPPSEGNLAYVIYTSGSTGRPKGVMIPHRGIVNRLLWMQEAYGLTEGEGVLQKTPASFDVSVWELFWPLLVGARLVVARPGGHQDSAYLAGLIAEQRVTTIHFVPSMLQVFLEEPNLAAASGLRRVIVSGEALPRELQERFHARFGHTELHNLYGPTEASVDVTAWACPRGGEPSWRSVPIGRPIANLRIHILDAAGAPAPAGGPGHLHIAGVGLARGYLRRPGLTAERFVPDPFVPGERLYATGDLARLRPDGAIEFLGRLDHQIKIRGFRVELGEIEAALNAHPAVRESVVVARREPTGPRIVAYLVSQGPAPQLDDLAASLGTRLPAYMVPSAFVMLEAFPLTPSGKVDRKLLPAPDEDARLARGPRIAPRTPLEQRLADLWREQLGVPDGGEIGIDDSFFELGGDSIQGALFINRLQRELGAIVYVMALFDHPTVASLAAYLEESYRDSLLTAGWLTEEDREAKEPLSAVHAETDEADLRALDLSLAGRFSPPSPPAAVRNPPAVFLLSPFRSGSTLLRVMLAGHPGLFAPPELELLGFDTLGERRRVFSGRDSFSREGLLRAVMELRGCDAETAAALVEEAEAADLPAPAFYARLQEWAGDRLLVDKTPRYALDRPTLARAESWFERPLYVHLVRHPVATIASYLEAKMDQVYPAALPAQRQAELVWRRSHENILAHLAEIPAERQQTLRFEDLVRDPRAAMESLGRFLGIGFEPAMLSPYEGERMTDGIRREGRMMGDPKFHQHRQIEAGAADRWRDAPESARLSAATWDLAERLGYERPAPVQVAVESIDAPRPLPRPAVLAVAEEPVEVGLPLSFTQQRLWFLDRLEPGSSAYNMPAAVRLSGWLDAPALASACAEIERRHEVLRSIFPAGGGRPRLLVRAAWPDHHPVVDLAALPETARQAEAERLAQEEAESPFDLEAGPLWRIRLLRIEPMEHLLLVNLHHIVSDGWSIGVLTRELSVLYEAFSAGVPSPLPDPGLQYADFAAWQRSRLTGEVLAGHLREERERLSGPLPALELPTDRPRPAVQSRRGSRFGFRIAPKLTGKLRAIGRTTKTTLFMVLAASLQTLLFRYTGQAVVRIGAPVANRSRTEIEELIGPFVNTLVLQTDLSGDPDAHSLLGRVRTGWLAASRHEELPFEKLVEELGVERTLDRSPLFSVMLALQNAPPPALALPGLFLDRLDLGTRTAKVDLTVDLAERREDGGLAGSIEYNTDLFDAPTVAHLASHLTTLLTSLAEAPGARLSDLPLLAPAELRELIFEVNDTAAPFDTGARVHDLFLASARRSPEAVAVSFEGEQLLYGELAEQAHRLAGRLVSLGVGPEVRVAIYAERSPAMIVALLAVLEAGGAYVPLDPVYPKERVAYILGDSGARVVLTEMALAANLPEGPQAVLLEALEDLDDPAVLSTSPAPENLAYVIYTSGSTGRPKGVELSHRGVVNYLTSMARRPGLVAGDTMLALTTLSFDIAVTELFLPLMVGGRIELVRRETAGDAERLAAAIGAAQATAMQATPATWTLLLDGGWQGRPGLKALCGGEALPRVLADRLLPHVGELWNVYGPTETTVWSTLQPVGPGERVTIGSPLANTTVYLLDPAGNLVPKGVTGELTIGGAGLARGYHGRPALTAERFVPDPFGPPGSRLYRTGDLARRIPGGKIEHLGRADHQVKVRGVRIELQEIEAVLLEHPAVRQTAVAVVSGGAGDRAADQRLVAWVVRASGWDLSWESLRAFLTERLPLPMVPSAMVPLDALPLLPSGKVDRKSLPDPAHYLRHRPDLAASYVSPQSELEQAVAQIWQEVLGLERVGVDDNFFDLGGHSLAAAEVHGKLREQLAATDLTLVELFRYPTVRALAARLTGEERPSRLAAVERPAIREREDIAIVGMAGRFPGAADLDVLWHNLREGVESVTFFSDAELLAAGVSPESLADPRYVRARAVLDGAELFDAAHFGFSPREAAITDPQQRVLLECASDALENAGLDPGTFHGRIGVYAGSVISTYLLFNLLPQAMASDEGWQMVLSNDKDTLATRLAYKLNLRGPSLTVQTACSTSLVAVHLARQALLEGECDAALAGGVSVRSQQTSGYLYQDESILSPDGHCRPFDARARGTLFGSGAGVVVLKRLSDALAAGDTIHAVIKSSALNNDGSAKVGFMAPSIEGQAEVTARALALGGIDPETVTYVETHGSATPLGDPIEVAGLTRAFRSAGAERSSYCAIGSVKSNFGHLDAASGIAGLLKTVLALEHGEIPPSLNFEQPNPQIDFAGSPFFVNDRLRPWPQENGPRRAGVSSFGIGGTNAHIVLEEAPASLPTSASRPLSLLLFSARTPGALAAARDRLRQHLEQHPETALADAAYTTQIGRKAFAYRQAVLAESSEEAVALLSSAAASPDRVLSGTAEGRERRAAFLFPGVGEHYPGMAADLYRGEEVFRREIDRCAELLQPILGADLRDILYPAGADGSESKPAGMDLRRMLGRSGGQDDPAQAALTQTRFAHPAVFAVEYALARLWMSWGIQPQALIGYSLGEYVAACLSGVLSLEDALALVGLRAKLIEELPAGRMLAVAASEASLRPLLSEGLWLAAANGPDESVVSGEPAAVAVLERRLAQLGIPSVPVSAAHAFHSAMLEPAAAELTAAAGKVALGAPVIPYLSNRTGHWITEEETRDPEYWARHMCESVRFAEGLELLLADPGLVLLEVGPGQSLATLARRSPRRTDENVVLTSLRHRDESRPDLEPTLASLGRLWAAGAQVDWRAFHSGEKRRLVPLPTYPFERRRHWVEPSRDGQRTGKETPTAPSSRFLLPSWRRSLAPEPAPAVQPGTWLVFLDRCGLGQAIAQHMERRGCEVIRVAPGEAEGEGAAALPRHLREDGRNLRGIVHLGNVTSDLPDLDESWKLGFASLDALTKALQETGEKNGVAIPAVAAPPAITAITNGAQAVTGDEDLCPAKATVLGWARSAPQEGPRRRGLDVALPAPGSSRWAALADRLASDILSAAAEPLVAWRGPARWVPALEEAPFATAGQASWQPPSGVYLLAGGAGGPSLALAQRLAAAASVKLVFVEPPSDTGPSPLPQSALEGTEVLILEADLTNPVEARTVLDQVETRWGPLQGVFFLPPPGAGPTGEPDARDWMRSALELDRALGDRPLGSFVLFSWTEPPAPWNDRAEHQAASALLDTLAHSRAARGASPAVAIDWPAKGLDAQSSWEAIRWILSNPSVSQVAVSAPEGHQAFDDGEDAAHHLNAEEFVAPDDPISERVAAIWSEILGVRHVGLHDRFFELGGDSLIALRVISRIQETFPIDLTVRALLERPTLAGFRDAIEEALTAKIEQLSEWEAEQLMASLAG